KPPRQEPPSGRAATSGGKGPQPVSSGLRLVTRSPPRSNAVGGSRQRVRVEDFQRDWDVPDLASWGTLALVVLIVTAGAAGQAAIGMGLNLFTIPFLVMIDPVFAPGPVLAASLLLSLLAMWRVPGEIDRRELALLLCGLIVGTLIAAAIRVIIDAA